MAPRGPVRAFAPADIEDMLAGARVLPGFTHKAVRDMRKRLGLGARDAAPTDQALALLKRMVAFGWCRHEWRTGMLVALPVTIETQDQVFASLQGRACRRCGCAQSRMLTAAGYATEWTGPTMPIRREG